MSLTGAAFLLAFLGGLGLCVARGPIWGLYTYLAVFYLDPPSRWWGAALPSLRWSLVAAAVTLIAVLARRKTDERAPFFSHGLTWILFLYVAWMWFQLTFAISASHLTGVVLFTKYMVLLYLIYVIVDSYDRVRDFLLAHVAGCFFLGWLAFTAPGGGRLEGVGGAGINDANTMSMHFGTGVIVASMLLMTERGWRFWLPLAALPFMLNGMVQGVSRGAFVGLFAAGLCLFWLKPPAFRRQFIAFGALGVLLFGYLANDFFLERMASLEAVTSDDKQLDFSAESRLVIVQAQWQMFLDHPFGAGHGGTAALSPNYLSREYLTVDPRNPEGQAGRSSHNTFMSILVDQGVPGIILLFALLAWVWTAVGYVTKRSGAETRVWGYGAAISAALALAAVAGQFAPYLKAEVQIWLLGLLLCLRSLTARAKASVAERQGALIVSREVEGAGAIPQSRSGAVSPPQRPSG